MHLHRNFYVILSRNNLMNNQLEEMCLCLILIYRILKNIVRTCISIELIFKIIIEIILLVNKTFMWLG